MEIRSVSEDNIGQVLAFLEEIAVINDINEDVVRNGEFVFDGEIIGLLSFEEFNRIGLIRYFVFKKAVSESLISELFQNILKKAKAKEINSLITLVVKKEAIDIFRSLGFYEIEKKDVFIEETNLLNTKFKDACVLKYDIETKESII